MHDMQHVRKEQQQCTQAHFPRLICGLFFVGKGGGGGRRSSGCSTDSWSSYDSLDEDDENLPHPRERPQVNSQGFSEFCVRNIDRHELGRREIDLAEMEMTGILAFRQKATPDKPLKGSNLN